MSNMNKDEQCKRFHFINELIKAEKVECFMHTPFDMKMNIKGKNGGVIYPEKEIEADTLIILIRKKS